MTSFPPESRMMSGPGLLPKAKSFWGALSNPSEAPVTTEGPADTCSLGHHLGPCWCSRAAMQQGP